MKILKKIIALAIILGMFGQTSLNSFSSYNYELENIEYVLSSYSNNIKNDITNGDEYILKIDLFISKINDKQANILENKLSKKFKKPDIRVTEYNNLSKDEKIEMIVNYIYIKLEERKLLKAEEEKKNTFNSTLSDSDTKKVNEELVKIQNNLLNRGVDSFEQILGELETYTNYEERGNFEAKVNFDGGEIGTSKFELKLKDYITKSSGFDAQFKSKIEAIIEASPKGQEEVKIKINAFIDYILKDQNYYVLLKDLKITDEKGIDEIKSFVEKAKEIASNNKYIHFEDKNATQALNMLKNLSPDNILKQGKIIASKPLFTAYKKEGNKYYLIPSKYGCDTAKTISQTFDPFNGNTCTESQYEDLLEDIADSKVEFYIDFSVNNTIIGFEANGVDDMEEFTGDVSFSDKYIEEINFIIKPNQEDYPLEGFSLNYKRNNFLNSSLYADKGKSTLDLKSKLDRYNNFSFIDFNFNIEDFSGELKLNNKTITGKYGIEKNSGKMIGLISGKTDRYNKISQLKIENQYINSSEYNPGETNTVLEYNNGKYSVDNKYVSEGFKADFNALVTIKNKTLSELDFNLEASKKDSTFDYDSYKNIYSGDFKKIVDSNITLKNKNISGKTVIYQDEKQFLEITNTGKLEANKLELNNKINFNYALSKYIVPVYGNEEKKEDKSEANFNIKTDTTSNNNNINIYFDYIEEDKKMLEIELDNKSKKTYKKIDIMAPLPNNTIELEDAISNPTLY